MALYLHNSLVFIPETQHADDDFPFPHSRTLSSGTLRTVTSEGNTTEPLLSIRDQQSQTFQELLSLQPTHPDGPDPAWDMRLSLDGFRPNRSVPGGVDQHVLRRRMNNLRWTIVSMQSVIALWATYSAIRYFIAFGNYHSSAGQSLSIALGTTSLVSVIYLACSQAVRSMRSWFARLEIPLRHVRLAETIFRVLTSIFFVAPAVINLIIVLVYKSQGNTELVVLNRCALDADLLWAGGNSSCMRTVSYWGVWVAVSAVRLFLCLLIVVILHSCVFSFQQILSRPPGQKFTPSPRKRSKQRWFDRMGTMTSSQGHLTSPPLMAMMSSNSPSGTIQPTRHPSVSQTLSVNPSIETPSDPSKHLSQSPIRTPVPAHRSRSTSPTHHPEHYYTESDIELLARTSQGSSPSLEASTSSSSHMDDRELHAFVDQFRSMVTQISREAEDAIEFAQPGPTGSYQNTIDMGPQLPSAIVGFDELGRPYAAEEHVRILNGFVRRMPTIESIGSRELESMRSYASRGEFERMERMPSLQELSRPGTQLTMRTDTTATDYGQLIRSGLFNAGSGPPSRSNSINTGPSRANSVNWTASGTPVTAYPELEAPWAGPPLPPSPVSPIFPVAAALVQGSTVTSSTSSSSHSVATAGSAASSFRSAESGGSPTELRQSRSISHPYRTASPVETMSS